jgi:TP901 family phage tail tape measure protein
MPVSLPVELTGARQAAETAARDIASVFNKFGTGIGGDFGRAIGRGIAAFDTGPAVRQLEALEGAYRRTSDAERTAADRMVARQAAASAAVERYGQDSAKAATAAAVANKSQRDYTDALVANEAAHRSWQSTAADSHERATALGRTFNAVGIGSVAALGTAFVETTKKAGDFQASQTRLVASAGETSANLKTVSDGILQLAGQVGYGAQELSKSMYMVEKAGIRGGDAVTVMRSAAQGAKSENAELGEVLNGLTTTMTDFHYSADQSADVMSKMVAATSMAKTNFQDFSGALHTAEPLMANIGKSQGLNTDQMHHLMADLYGVIAVQTQSGDTAEHASQIYAHATQKMLSPTAQMRSMMGALGIDAEDVQDHLGERGLAGTMQMLTQAVQQHTKDGKVNLDAHYQSAQLARAETEAFNGLSPAARNVAEEIKNGTLSYKEFRKSRGGLSVEQANEIGQWNALNNKLTGFSDLIKSGIGDQIGYDQALKILTGDQLTLQAALQTSGENTDRTNDSIKQINQTVREHDGTVKGFNETQTTLNAKMADAKAAFGAAAIEMGSAFIPVMTDVANVAKDVGDAMAKHPGIAHDVVTALEGLSGAWLTFKALNIAETILMPVAKGLGSIIAEEDGAALGAARLSGAMSAIGKGGALAVGAQLGGQALQDATAGDSFWNGAAVVGTDAATGAAVGGTVGSIVPGLGTGIGAAVGGVLGGGVGLYNQLSRAYGGAVYGHGPKGIDSVPAMLAPGEHVLTHHDVAAMGGHSAVHSFRHALHRAEGGEIPGFDGGGSPGYDGNMGGGTVNAPLLNALRNAGINPAMYPLIQGFARTEGNNPSGVPTLGFTDSQAGSSLEGHAAALSRQLQARQSVAGAFPATGTPQQQASWMATVVGQNGVSSDWQGNRQPPRQDYVNSILSGFGGKVPMGSQGDPLYVSQVLGHGGMPAGATAGTGPLGQPGYFAASPERVASAEERLRHLDQEIATAEERKREMKADAKQSERDRLDEEIRHLHVEHDEAEARLQKAEQGTFHESRGGGSGRGGMGDGLPVPLDDRMGTGGGLPGMAKYAISFLEDLVLGPMETAVMAGLNGGGAGLGMPGAGMPSLAGYSSPDGGSGPGVAGPDWRGGGSGGGSEGGSGGSGGAGGARGAASRGGFSHPGTPVGGRGGFFGGAGAPAPGPTPNGPGIRTQQDYKMFVAGVLDADGNPTAPMGPDEQRVLAGTYGDPSLRPSWSSPFGTDTPDPDPNSLLTGAGGTTRGFWGKSGISGNTPSIGPAHQGPMNSLTPPMHFSSGGQVGYFDDGGPSNQGGKPAPQSAPQAQHMVAPQQPATGPGGPAAPQSGAPKQSSAATMGGSTTHSLPGLKDPGSLGEYVGAGQTPSAGIGFSGGIIGAAESAASSAAMAAAAMYRGGAVGYFGDGGPSGKDTIPAWLAPGEHVLTDDDVDAMGGQAGVYAFRNALHASLGGAVRYFDAGGASSAGAPSGGGGGGGGDAAGGIAGPAFAEINRAAAEAAQAGAIGVEGLLSTFKVSGSGTGQDWSKTIPGRLLGGVAGVRPSQNTAGQAQGADVSGAPGTQSPSVSGGMGNVGTQIGHVSIHAQDPSQFESWSQQQSSMAINTQGMATAGGAGSWR